MLSEGREPLPLQRRPQSTSRSGSVSRLEALQVHLAPGFVGAIAGKNGLHGLQVLPPFALARLSRAKAIGQVLLRGAHAVTAIAFRRDRVVGWSLRPPQLPNPEPPLGVEPNASSVPLHPESPGYRRHLLGAAPAVGVDEAQGSAFEGNGDERLVFAPQDRVDAPQAAKESAQLSAQVTESVKVVDESLVNQEALHFAEVRLERVRRRPGAVARAPLEGDLKRTTGGAGIDEPPDLAVPGLPAPVLVDKEALAGLFAGLHHGHAVFPAR